MKWQRTGATSNRLMYSLFLAFHYTQHLHLVLRDQCDVPDRHQKSEYLSFWNRVRRLQ